MLSDIIEVRKSAVCKSSITNAKDHASTNIIIAVSMVLNPLIAALIDCCIFKSFCPTEREIATNNPANEDHNRALYESALPIMEEIFRA